MVDFDEKDVPLIVNSTWGLETAKEYEILALSLTRSLDRAARWVNDNGFTMAIIQVISLDGWLSLTMILRSMTSISLSLSASFSACLPSLTCQVTNSFVQSLNVF